jgi:hypothetical protein
MKVAGTGASPGGGLPEREWSTDELGSEAGYPETENMLTLRELVDRQAQEAGDGEQPLLQREGSMIMIHELIDWCKELYSRKSVMLKTVSVVGIVVFCVIALCAAAATTPQLGVPDPPPSRGTRNGGVLSDSDGSRKTLLGTLDTMCFYPPCNAAVEEGSSLTAQAQAGLHSTSSGGLPSAAVNSVTTTPTRANAALRARSNWKLVAQNASCSTHLCKTLAADRTSLPQCMGLAVTEPACGNQIYSDGSLCRCVIGGLTCDFQASRFGNVYEWQVLSRNRRGKAFPQHNSPTQLPPLHPTKANGTTTSSMPATATKTTTATATTTASHELIEKLHIDKLPKRSKQDIDPSSLFCFMLVVPWGDEPKVVTWQRKARKGIFQCDKYSIYSNVTGDVLSGLPITVVHSDLFCPMGGQWNTRLNTPIFIKLWDQVLHDGVYRSTAWTVKLDPDTVFFPQRLRDVVESPAHHSAQEEQGLFSDNCEYKGTLHGPIELLSRRAVEVYAVGHKNICTQPPQEDVYMRSCLLKLGVKRVQDFILLAEQSCFWDWESCKSSRVAFHPFKTLQSQWGCYGTAENNGKWFDRRKPKSERPLAVNT